jgi:hypothetical protein
MGTDADRCALLDKYRLGNLNAFEQQVLWVMVSDLVYSRSRTHYGRKQSYGRRVIGRSREWYEIPNDNDSDRTQMHYEAHIDRMHMFLRYIKENQHKSIQLLITEWRRRYAWFEMVRELEKCGIGHTSEKSLTSQVNQSLTRYLIETKKMIRCYQAENPDEPLDAEQIVNHWVTVNPDKYSLTKIKNMTWRVYTYLYCLGISTAETFTESSHEHQHYCQFSCS